MTLGRSSQLGQDDKCLSYFNHKKNGFFVDIGAHDGIDLSNTYKLEKDYEWTGICVEPLTRPFNECKMNRPNSICINKCIFNKNGFVPFEEKPEKDGSWDMISGICDENNKTCDKECITFTKLLEDNNAPSIIDFLSIDTEGSELEILKSLDHNKFKFQYITCEHNYKPLRKDIKDYLENNGYLFHEENNWDDIYILRTSPT